MRKRDAYGKRRLVPLCALLLFFGGRYGTTDAVAANIARGKPYEWSTPPRYGQCTDDGDTTQLTDGVSKSADWTVASTVGWVHKGRVAVTIDLGRVQPVGRVAFVAAGGGLADVFFPAVTAILVGDDGQTWHVGAAVGSGGLLQDRSKSYSHRFETAGLQARGRYVRLVFQAEERYLFIDEVEIESGVDGPTPAHGEPVGEDDLEVLLSQGLRARWVAGEWHGFRDGINTYASRTGGVTPEIARRIEEIDENVLHLDVTDANAVEALRTAYTDLRAETARAVHGAGLHAQRVYPWAELRGETFPPALAAMPVGVDLLAWRDEYETVAWAVTNLDRAARRVRIRVGPLRDGQGHVRQWAQRLQFREGMAIPTRVGYRVVDALPLLSDGERNTGEVDVGPGEYRLLWMTVCARGLSAGSYTAEVRIEALPSEELLLRSPLTLTVAALRMPPTDERALSACVWDEHLVNKPPEVAEDLRAHGVNTFVLHPISLPRPVFDRDRTRLESVDFAPLDSGLARRGERPRMHGVFWGGNPSFWGLDLETPRDAELFKKFIRAWAGHLQANGIGPDRFFFYPLDEEMSERMVRLARLIREADPRLQVYWNQVNAPDVDTDLMRQLAPYVDIACVKILTMADHDDTARQESVFGELREKHPFKVWTYACGGPGRLKATDTYYRNLSWETFRRGGTGTGVWCYADGGAWDAYEGGIHYGVVYLAENAPPGVTRAEPIIPSRRWEAFRECTEDFEYLSRLQGTIAAARKARVPPRQCDRAATLLKDAVDRVLTDADDPDRYDRARRTLTGAILDLRRQTSALKP